MKKSKKYLFIILAVVLVYLAFNKNRDMDKDEVPNIIYEGLKKNNIKLSDFEDYTIEDIKALNNGEEPVTYFGSFGQVNSLSGNFANFKVESPFEAFLAIYQVRSLFQIQDPKSELKWDNSISNEWMTIHRFNQVYKGIEVYFGSISLTTDKEGNVLKLVSSHIPKLNIDVNPKISKYKAIWIAKKSAGIVMGKTGSSLVIYTNSENIPILTWIIYVENLFSISDETTVYINATNGNVEKMHYDYVE